MNPGYYESLKHAALNYPHPGPQQVEKDLVRSGVSPKEMESMRNVLCAYINRNPTVGYC